jgi:hypothetical protein
MSLFKTVLVVGALVALLPTDKGRQQQLYAQAAASAEHLITYCDRNPETCQRAGEHWETFKVKARFAGELALDVVRRYASRDSGAPSGETRGTLTGEDLAPAWRGAQRGI